MGLLEEAETSDIHPFIFLHSVSTQQLNESGAAASASLLLQWCLHEKLFQVRPDTSQWQTTRQYEARQKAARFTWLLDTSSLNVAANCFVYPVSGFSVVVVISWLSETLLLVFSSALTLHKCDFIHTQVLSHLEQL